MHVPQTDMNGNLFNYNYAYTYLLCCNFLCSRKTNLNVIQTIKILYSVWHGSIIVSEIPFFLQPDVFLDRLDSERRPAERDTQSVYLVAALALSPQTQTCVCF